MACRRDRGLGRPNWLSVAMPIKDRERRLVCNTGCQRRWVANQLAAGLCVQCGVNPLGRWKRMCDGCMERYRATTARLRRVLRAEMIQAYGAQCACCSEDTPEFLTLDHINGDGAKERRESQSNRGNSFLVRLKREGWPKERYRLLCWNCNCARAHHGVCPHELQRSVGVA